MSFVLTAAEFEVLCEQTPPPKESSSGTDTFETLYGIAPSLGRGCSREVDLAPGIVMSFSEYEYHRDWQLRVPTHDHPIQICLFTLGQMDCSIHPILGNERGYLSGSGISPGYVETYQAGQTLSVVNVELQPSVLTSLGLTDGQQSDSIRQLFKTDEYKTSFHPKVTAQMRSLAHQMWHAPYPW